MNIYWQQNFNESFFRQIMTKQLAVDDHVLRSDFTLISDIHNAQDICDIILVSKYILSSKILHTVSGHQSLNCV